jgi:phage N-6-adenine-methyltransferase
MKMPAQRPGSSTQEVGTPAAFLDAVQDRFGEITWDLAANQTNHVVDDWYGPGSQDGEDSLTQDWSANSGLLWLNPPYNRIRDFASKCKEESWTGAKIAMLIPASVATNWFADLIHGIALVMPIRPRLTFVGHNAPYPKDLMIVGYNVGAVGFEPWRWTA